MTRAAILSQGHLQAGRQLVSALGPRALSHLTVMAEMCMYTIHGAEDNTTGRRENIEVGGATRASPGNGKKGGADIDIDMFPATDVHRADLERLTFCRKYAPELRGFTVPAGRASVPQ